MQNKNRDMDTGNRLTAVRGVERGSIGLKKVKGLTKIYILYIYIYI